LSSARPRAILAQVILSAINRFIAILLSICLIAASMPRVLANPAGGKPERARIAAGADPAPHAADEHFLRDAIPVAGFATEPPDTTEDDFFLPEETDKKKLYRDIAVFVVVSAFVAFFIIKVFIEEDDEPADPEPPGKDIP